VIEIFQRKFIQQVEIQRNALRKPRNKVSNMLDFRMVTHALLEIHLVSMARETTRSAPKTANTRKISSAVQDGETVSIE